MKRKGEELISSRLNKKICLSYNKDIEDEKRYLPLYLYLEKPKLIYRTTIEEKIDLLYLVCRAKSSVDFKTLICNINYCKDDYLEVHQRLTSDGYQFILPEYVFCLGSISTYAMNTYYTELKLPIEIIDMHYSRVDKMLSTNCALLSMVNACLYNKFRRPTFYLKYLNDCTVNTFLSFLDRFDISLWYRKECHDLAFSLLNRKSFCIELMARHVPLPHNNITNILMAGINIFFPGLTNVMSFHHSDFFLAYEERNYPGFTTLFEYRSFIMHLKFQYKHVIGYIMNIFLHYENGHKIAKELAEILILKEDRIPYFAGPITNMQLIGKIPVYASQFTKFPALNTLVRRETPYTQKDVLKLLL